MSSQQNDFHTKLVKMVKQKFDYSNADSPSSFCESQLLPDFFIRLSPATHSIQTASHIRVLGFTRFHPPTIYIILRKDQTDHTAWQPLIKSAPVVIIFTPKHSEEKLPDTCVIAETLHHQFFVWRVRQAELKGDSGFVNLSSHADNCWNILQATNECSLCY